MVTLSDATHTEVVHARGHENVTATHESTFELTTDEFLTPAGDCILGIEADRAPAAFDEAFIAACRDPTAEIMAVLEVDGRTTRVTASGASGLSLTSDRSLVVRTSDYVDARTVAVGATAAAADIDRGIVDALAAGAELTLTLGISP
ncbi:MAG: uncharacterized protein conserved in archaea [halophilic archaeon J07HX5]|nr:MAG: uncharacterized protein conserved in archaea [halophilic archaeon J07HX5]